jgi:hypothetical protein
MKTYRHIYLSVCVVLLLTSHTQETTLSIQDAMKDSNIEIKWMNNESSPHYKMPLIAEFSNNKSVPVKIDISAGVVVEAEDAVYQNLVTTEQHFVLIPPGKTVRKELHAMCIEPSDAAGKATTTYKFVGSKNEKLTSLAKFIAEKNYNSSEGQYAIWTLLRGGELSEVYGEDTLAAFALQQFLAKQLGYEPVKTLQTVNTFSRNYYYRGPLEIELSGFYEYQLASAKSVEVAMFNDRNILVRELLKKHVSTPGKHRFDYTFDGNAFEEDVYFVRLIVEDKIVLSRRIPLKEWKQSFEQQR